MASEQHGTDPIEGERPSVELQIALPPERVWSAITDPVEIARWHGWDYDGLDEEIDQIFISGASADQDALTLDTGDGRFELAEAGDGSTRLRVIRVGPTERDAIDQGWRTFAIQLRFYLERHLGAPRRTLYLTGLRRADSPASAAELSSIEPERALFAGEGQLAVPAGSGSGLLILTDNWMGHGTQVSALLSAYGLAADEFAELATRWRERFYESFEPIADEQSDG